MLAALRREEQTVLLDHAVNALEHSLSDLNARMRADLFAADFARRAADNEQITYAQLCRRANLLSCSGSLFSDLRKFHSYSPLPAEYRREFYLRPGARFL